MYIVSYFRTFDVYHGPFIRTFRHTTFLLKYLFMQIFLKFLLITLKYPKKLTFIFLYPLCELSRAETGTLQRKVQNPRPFIREASTAAAFCVGFEATTIPYYSVLTSSDYI